MCYLQDVDKDHGIGDVAVEFLLLGHVRQVDEGPGHDSRTTIEEQLEVEPLADARVEFDAHHVVVEKVPREFAAASQKLTNDAVTQEEARMREMISTAVTGKRIKLTNNR